MRQSSVWTMPISRPLKPSNYRHPERRSPLRLSLVLVMRHNISMLTLGCHNPNTKALLLRPKWLMRGSIIFKSHESNGWSPQQCHFQRRAYRPCGGATQNKGRGEPFSILCAYAVPAEPGFSTTSSHFSKKKRNLIFFSSLTPTKFLSESYDWYIVGDQSEISTKCLPAQLVIIPTKFLPFIF